MDRSFSGVEKLKGQIEVFNRSEISDVRSEEILQDIIDLGISGISSVHICRTYSIEGKNLNSAIIRKIANKLLVDPVTENFVIDRESEKPETSDGIIEVKFRWGVTDAVGESVRKGSVDIGIFEVDRVETGWKYQFRGDLSREKLETIATRLLANDVVEDFHIIYKS